MATPSKIKTGFTLVELSIVLVIIGLLVGGILVGQSLIQSTKVQSQVREIQQYDAMIDQFKLKYKTLPGDSKLFEPNGDADGYIDSVLPGTTPPAGGMALFAAEQAGFWKHLSDAGMTKAKYTDVLGSGGSVAGVNFPKAVYGNGVVIIAGYVASFPGTTKNILMYNNFSYNSGGTTSSFSYEFLAADALAIDQKLDDGAPATGNVFGSGTTCRNVSVLYAVELSTAKCQLMIGIGTQAR